MFLEVQNTFLHYLWCYSFVIMLINQKRVLSLPHWGTQEIPQNEATMEENGVRNLYHPAHVVRPNW